MGWLLPLHEMMFTGTAIGSSAQASPCDGVQDSWR
jgi:hypothetical protein